MSRGPAVVEEDPLLEAELVRRVRGEEREVIVIVDDRLRRIAAVGMTLGGREELLEALALFNGVGVVEEPVELRRGGRSTVRPGGGRSR